MRKLILQEWLSLDGFANDKNGGLDFFPASDANRYSDEDQLQFLETIDTMILARKTYELFVDFWPTATNDKEVIADKLNSLEKIIVSNTLTKAPWGNFPDATIISGDVIKAIKDLKAKEGKDIVVWGSISLAKALIKENLFDAYHFQLCPTATGGGTTLFPDLNSYKNFKLVHVKKYESGAIAVHYELDLQLGS